jgi:hypothetical protein
MHPDQCRADRNVGDNMSMAGTNIHSDTPPGTPSLVVRDTPFQNGCQLNYDCI